MILPLAECALACGGAVLFFLSHPNALSAAGFSAVAWVMRVPFFILASKVPLKRAPLAGAVHGALSYALLVPWLFTFSRPSFFAVVALYSIYHAALLSLCAAERKIRAEGAWVSQWLSLCAFEFASTKGYVGFGYGVSAYTQWRFVKLIQCADIFGVWGICALVNFSSALVARFICARSEWKKNLLCLSLFAACFSAVLIYGAAREKKFSREEKTVAVCAVQHNADPWKASLEGYARDIESLESLTDEALSMRDGVALVAWPETAVVPSIARNWEERRDGRRLKIVSDVLSYIDSKDASFVVGNFNSVKNGGEFQDFNSALFFTPKADVIPPNPAVYSKMHLVPFAESFPFKRLFPRLQKKLLAGDTHWWTAGSERTVFSLGDFKFASPICFEDTFGDDCRLFVKAGARAFVNLSNDAWSKSVVCQKQHLSMAVFRSAENRVPSVRSSASGQTCAIDRAGRVTAESKPFQKNYVVADIALVPRSEPPSLYTRAGDWAGFLVLAAALASVAFSAVVAALESRRFNRQSGAMAL